MTTLSIANFKGGVAKTTTSINISGILANKGHKVLIVDIDPQGNVASALGAKLDNNQRSLYEAILDQRDLPIYHIRPNLDICPSDVRMINIDAELAGTKRRVFRLSNLLKPLEGQYDYIIIDSPPNHGSGSNSALIASDYVLIPMEASLFSIKGLKEMLETIEYANRLNPKTKILGIVVTRFRKTKDHIAALNELRNRYTAIVMNTIIRESASISSAQLARTDVLSFSPGSIGATDYSALVEEMITKLNAI